MRVTHRGRGQRTRVPHAKIVVPRVPASFVRRKPLRDLLVRAVEAPVTTVCAPAGYGKTLLLADWIETTGEADKAWISLDGADNEPGQFWSEVLTAIRGCEIVPQDSRLTGLVPPAGPDVANFLAEFVDALDALPDRLWLVLDDVHEMVGAQALHGIETLIRHQPGALRLVLSSRRDPPLPLARLRVQGRLSVIRAQDLRFSEVDAGKLLAATGVSLNAGQLRRLVEQTEGWAAGLRLAARSLREVPDRDAFLTDFVSDDRAVADYLVGEVLTHLPGETAEFLRVISVCEEVEPLLAGVLSGRGDAGAVLGALERESSLVMAVGRDRRWYRMHPLLRAYLRGDLDRQRPDLAADLHRVAAAWFASDEQPHKALEHAAQADERGTVVELLRRHAVALLLNGDHPLVRRALSIVGAPVAAADPWLALISALAHLEAGELDAAGANLADAGTLPVTDGERGLVSFRRLVASTYALACGDTANPARIDWHDVVSPREGPGLEAWARLGVGWELIRAGERAGARHELDAAEQLARGQGLDYLVMHTLTAYGAASGIDGDYDAMETACAEAVTIADRAGWRKSPWLAVGHVMLGFARLMRLDQAGALDEAARAGRTVDRASDRRLHYLICLLEGAAGFDAGRRSAGFQVMGQARRELGNVTLLPELVLAGALIEYRCALLLERDAPAREVFLWARKRVGSVAESSLMVAWHRFAHGDVEAAGRVLEGALDGSRPVLSATTRVEGWLLKSAVAIRSDRRTIARDALDNAVRLAERGALIRPFAQADLPVRQLLVDQIGGFGRSDAFAARVRLVLSDVDGQRRDGMLTERENMVLAGLTSQRSLDEVAVDLSVSVNTIKTHVRAIYAKLGVNNRRAAVAAARERGLA